MVACAAAAVCPSPVIWSKKRLYISCASDSMRSANGIFVVVGFSLVHRGGSSSGSNAERVILLPLSMFLHS